MNNNLIIPAIIGTAMVTLLYLAAATLPSLVIFIPVVVLTYFFYLATVYKKAPRPEKILPLYLLGLAVQCLHFAEEYITGFNTRLPALFGWPAFPLDDWVLFNMGAYAFFILGGIVWFRRIKMFAIIPVFFIMAGVIGNAVAHVALSVVVKGYFPGLYTALSYLVIGPMILRIIIRESRVEDP